MTKMTTRSRLPIALALPACLLWGILPRDADAREPRPENRSPMTDRETSPAPEAVISRDRLKVRIYLPDAERGFYRGKRFDWSGMIHRVEYGEHTFYGPWQTSRNPTGHDHNSVGPCEEFGMQEPLGYTEARPGETFIKIGVGHLKKLDGKKYSFDGKYPVARPGAWKILREKDWIRFEQSVRDERGWGYRYVKTIRLVSGSPIFDIEHELENTGKRRIDTDFYNHNFTSIDDERIGKNYQLSFSFPFTPRRSLRGVAEARGKTLRFLKDLPTPLFTEIDGLKGTVEDAQFTIENLKSGAGVRISGDRAPFKINFYTAPRAIAPEAFLRLVVEPGKTLSWKIRYELLTK